MSQWLKPIQEQLPPNFSKEDSDAFQKALMDEAMRRIQGFLSGVVAYQNHPTQREDNPVVQVLWQEGTTRLLDYAPESLGPALFVIPSLVNRFDILDIDPERSFLRYLAAQGFRPLVVDWQEPGEEEQAFALSDYMTKRLEPLLALAVEKAGPCHLLGYCMGGVLALALAQRQAAQTKTLTLLATPWDFVVAGVGGVPPVNTPMGQSFIQCAKMVDTYLDQLGFLPSAFLQSIFTAFQPTQILQKFSRFCDLPLEEERTRRFVLTEDWLNNGVSLALPVARECLRDWYVENKLASLSWSIDGQLVDPRKIDVPTYLLIAGNDRIVPPASSAPLIELIRGVTLHEPRMGHIGLMTGDAALHEVWEPLSLWLKSFHAE